MHSCDIILRVNKIKAETKQDRALKYLQHQRIDCLTISSTVVQFNYALVSQKKI